MDILEKAAYLKGLVEGLGIDDSTKEGKVIQVMAGLLSDMAQAVCDVDDDLGGLYEVVDSMGKALGMFEDQEEDSPEGEDDADEPCYEVECPACGSTVYVTEADLEEKEAFCEHCGRSFGIELAGDGPEQDEEDEQSGQDAARYELRCPHCGAVSAWDEETLLAGEAVCPHCGQTLEPGGE